MPHNGCSGPRAVISAVARPARRAPPSVGPPGMWGYSCPHDETTVFNTDFPEPASRKVATKPTHFVHPHSWFQPTKTPTFPHRHAEKSPLQQHVVSFNPITPRLRLVAATGGYKTRPDRSVRARNEIGSGVRTLAVVRAVLTTIATLTTPLRHVILLGFVV